MAITTLFRNIPRPIKIGAGAAGTWIALPNPFFSLPPLIFFSLAPVLSELADRNFFQRFILLFSFYFAVLAGLAFPFNFTPDNLNCFGLLALGLTFILSSLIYAFFTAWGKSPLTLACGWVTAHYLVSTLRCSIPLPIESALAPWPVLIQSAAIGGPYLLCFIIIFTNGMIACRARANFSPLAVLLSVNLIYGLIILHVNNNIAGSAVKLAIVQPSINQGTFNLMEKSPGYGKFIGEEMVALSERAGELKTELIVWPELAGNYILQNDRYLGSLSRATGSEMLIGTPYLDYLEEKKNYNSAFILYKNGETSAPYKKIGLFPLAESLFYSAGKEISPLPSETFSRIGTLICLESLYPEMASKLTAQGARLLCNISNDAAFGNSSLIYIHQSLLALRAVENNRPAVFASNNGPSAVYDHLGRKLQAADYNRRELLFSGVSGQSLNSIWSGAGRIFPWLCMGILSVGLFFEYFGYDPDASNPNLA